MIVTTEKFIKEIKSFLKMRYKEIRRSGRVRFTDDGNNFLCLFIYDHLIHDSEGSTAEIRIPVSHKALKDPLKTLPRNVHYFKDGNYEFSDLYSPKDTIETMKSEEIAKLDAEGY